MADLLKGFVESHQAAIRAAVPENGKLAEPEGFTPDTRPRYRVLTAADALAPRPPISWVISNLIRAGSLSLLVGAPGSFKTYAALSAAVCVALGKPWLSMATIQGKTLVVDEESGEDRLSRRLGEVIRGELGDETTSLEYVSLAAFNLTKPGDAALLQALIESSGAAFVVVDALADIMPGADENAVKDTQPVFLRLRKIAEDTRAAILLIHHLNKSGGYRGSTAISGAVDLLLTMTASPESKFIDFETEKARDTEPAKFTAKITFAGDQVYLSRAEQGARPDQLSRAQRWVLAYLTDNGPSTRKEIIDDPTTCSSRAASDAIYTLADRGLIVRTNPEERTARGVGAIYALADADDDWAPDPDSYQAAQEQIQWEAENDIDLSV